VAPHQLARLAEVQAWGVRLELPSRTERRPVRLVWATPEPRGRPDSRARQLGERPVQGLRSRVELPGSLGQPRDAAVPSVAGARPVSRVAVRQVGVPPVIAMVRAGDGLPPLLLPSRGSVQMRPSA
jgi:hypothetical protein